MSLASPAAMLFAIIATVGSMIACWSNTRLAKRVATLEAQVAVLVRDRFPQSTQALIKFTRRPAGLRAALQHHNQQQRPAPGRFPCKVIALGFTASVARDFADARRASVRRVFARLAPADDKVCFSFIFGTDPPSQIRFGSVAANWLSERQRARAEDVEPRAASSSNITMQVPPRQFWADGVADDDALKVIRWFVEATRLTWAPFIGKADDDAYVQPAHLAADLAWLLKRLPNTMVMYTCPLQTKQQSCSSSGTLTVAHVRLLPSLRFGHTMMTPDWRVEATPGIAPTASAAPSPSGHPCGQPHSIEYLRVLSMRGVNRWAQKRRGCLRRLNPGHAGRVSGPFPWVTGPLEVFGLSLANRTFLSPAVAEFAARQRFSFMGGAIDLLDGSNGSKRRVDVWGEDPIIGYLAHFAATLGGYNFTIAHATANKVCDRATTVRAHLETAPRCSTCCTCTCTCTSMHQLSPLLHTVGAQLRACHAICRVDATRHVTRRAPPQIA